MTESEGSVTAEELIDLIMECSWSTGDLEALCERKEVMLAAIRQLAAERDTLAAANAKLRGAVLKYWWFYDEDNNAGCNHCRVQVELPEDFDIDWESPPVALPHAGTCIIRTLDSQ